MRLILRLRTWPNFLADQDTTVPRRKPSRTTYHVYHGEKEGFGGVGVPVHFTSRETLVKR